VPNKRRGAHPADAMLFADGQLARLRAAVVDFSWLMERDYGHDSSLKLVGDRYALTARQRVTVVRASCSDRQRSQRVGCRLSVSEVAGKPLWIDGFNLITTIEAALGVGVIFMGRDGCVRDMASMHGNYRLLADTQAAIEMILAQLTRLAPSSVHWYLDRPVSNNGRLKTVLLENAIDLEFETTVELVSDPDVILRDAKLPHILVSADSQILDRCEAWFPLAEAVVRERRVPWIDFSGQV
jgi:hypothetical protein